MSDSRPEVAFAINRSIAARVRALADEYGDLCAEGTPGPARRTHLAELLVAILRSLRIETVQGGRYRVVRESGTLHVERRNP